MIALDASGSVGASNFQKSKEFVADLAEVFSPDPNNRVSFQIFSYLLDSIFKLDNALSMEDMRAKIMGAHYPSSITMTHFALRHAIQEFEELGRKDVPQNFLVITDGISSNAVSL
jgi:hypothetical protein